VLAAAAEQLPASRSAAGARLCRAAMAASKLAQQDAGRSPVQVNLAMSPLLRVSGV
jgi:hypothetical protein